MFIAFLYREKRRHIRVIIVETPTFDAGKRG